MIYKGPSLLAHHIRVTFELPSCVWADQVYVAGDFNNWSQQALPMQQSRDGVWRAALDLPVGQSYQFRYVIDGQWHTDSHADGFSESGFGTENSVIHTAPFPQHVQEPSDTDGAAHRLAPAWDGAKTQPIRHRYEMREAAHRVPRGVPVASRRLRTPRANPECQS